MICPLRDYRNLEKTERRMNESQTNAIRFPLRLARGMRDTKVTQGPVRSVDSFIVRFPVVGSITFRQR
jgi:hypothetical protein